MARTGLDKSAGTYEDEKKFLRTSAKENFPLVGSDLSAEVLMQQSTSNLKIICLY